MDQLIEALDRDGSQFFTDQEVCESLLLTRKGEQRLRAVSKSQPSYFYFFAFYNGHYGPAEVCVSPIEHHGHLFYHPELRYGLCCSSQVGLENQFKEQYQAVYDARIRPSQWTFGDDGYES